MLERTIEKYLVYKVAVAGGKAYKWSSPSNKAVPDRICYFSENLIYLVECKATGGTPTPLQYKVHKFLRKLEVEVLVIDSKELVDEFIEMVKGDQNGQQLSI